MDKQENKDYCIRSLKEMGLRVDGDLVTHSNVFGSQVTINMNRVDHLCAPNVISALIEKSYKLSSLNGQEFVRNNIKESLTEKL